MPKQCTRYVLDGVGYHWFFVMGRVGGRANVSTPTTGAWEQLVQVG